MLILSASLGVVSRRKSITCIGIGLLLNQKVLKTITCIAEAKVSQLSDLSHLHRVVVATLWRACPLDSLSCFAHCHKYGQICRIPQRGPRRRRVVNMTTAAWVRQNDAAAAGMQAVAASGRRYRSILMSSAASNAIAAGATLSGRDAARRRRHDVLYAQVAI